MENSNTEKIKNLLSNGFDFEIKEKKKVFDKGFFKFFLPKIEKELIHKFHISEPTLSVLDRISLESNGFDESIFNNLENDSDQKKFSRSNLKRMAKIIAIMVCGPTASRFKIRKNSKLLFENLKPSELNTIIRLSDIMSNRGDFINATRLMSASETI